MFKLLSGCIESSDNLVTIYTDDPVDATIYGRVILLPSKTEIVIQFTKHSDKVLASRIRIDPDLLSTIRAAKLYIEVVSSSFNYTYPEYVLPVDLNKIKQTNIATKYKEVKELKAQIRTLEETLKALTEGRALTKIHLQNTDLISPGMIPVAIDNKGNFVGAYPFNDMIKDINGVKPAGGSLILNAEHIRLNSNITLEEAWQTYLTTTGKILDFIIRVEAQIKDLNNRLSKIDLSISTHINTGII